MGEGLLRGSNSRDAGEHVIDCVIRLRDMGIMNNLRTADSDAYAIAKKSQNRKG
jgi:hypothetical protein